MMMVHGFGHGVVKRIQRMVSMPMPTINNTTLMETAFLVQECQYYHMNEACSLTEKVAITIHCDD